MHFLMKCAFHDSEHITIIDNIYTMLQLDDKPMPCIDFKTLMNIKNKNMLRAQGCFVHTGFKKRDKNSPFGI